MSATGEELDAITEELDKVTTERDYALWLYKELEWRLRDAAMRSLAARPEAVKSLMERPDFQAKLQEQLMAQLNGGQPETPSRSPVE